MTERNSIPIGTSDLVDLSIAEAGHALRRREVSSVELTEATLRRIAQTEPLVHAYVVVLEERAREAAEEADRELARGEDRGPLHGIPLAVKDLFYTTFASTEAGSRAMRGFMAPYDATAVRLLEEGGAVIVGKTVTHEFAYGVNEPPTRNAWRPGYYPGGSSAGSGAAVAARSAFGALGTDTGGSIREPASLNGLVGLKPTFGLVSRHGVVPLSASLDTAGPMTRTVEDCALLLQAVAGYDPRDAGSIEVEIPDYMAGLEDGVGGMTVGVERSFFFGPSVREDVRAAVEGVIDELRRQGVSVVEVTLPELEYVSPVGLTVMLADASAFHRQTLREHAGEIEPPTRVMMELGELVPATHYVTALRARTVLRDTMRDLFRTHRLDAIISPTLPTPTIPIELVSQPDESGEEPLTTAIFYTFTANVTGQPALTVPCGFSADGLPIGFQLMGRPFQEATLFRLARAYERNHDWTARKPEIAADSASR